MALTEIARKLKETYTGFDVSGFQDELNRFRKEYGAAESIRIGDLDYIVIDDVYKNEEGTSTISPLFYNSINSKYAIIDKETSSTLIDEVYSLITYMQRDCESGARDPESEEIKNALRNIVGSSETVINAYVITDDDGDGGRLKNRANIFQCHLIKDTGVSAAPDVYSFMLKDGKPKEISDNAIKLIKDVGKLSMLDDSNMEELKLTEPAIQEAVFNKYINADIDIQSITVKSIFEIKMKYCNIELQLQSDHGDPRMKRKKINSVFRSSYLKSEKNEFDALNANIHVCGCCNNDIVDVVDASNVHRIHANLDAYDEDLTIRTICDKNSKLKREELVKNPELLRRQMLDNPDNICYVTGCQNGCLVECEKCHGWHLDYQKYTGTGAKIYDELKLVPGRAFVKGIRNFDINYCSCREGIEWVYDEFSGSQGEHDVIPIEEMGFFNYANEKLKGFGDYKHFLEKELKKVANQDAIAEKEAASAALLAYKKSIANEFNIEIDNVKVSSTSNCHECDVCGGEYHGRLKDGRCAICSEMFEENRRMITRVDGVVFMISGNRKNPVVTRYTVTKFGNLKRIGRPKSSGTSSEGDASTATEDVVNSAPAASKAVEENKKPTDADKKANEKTVSEPKKDSTSSEKPAVNAPKPNSNPSNQSVKPSQPPQNVNKNAQGAKPGNNHSKKKQTRR